MCNTPNLFTFARILLIPIIIFAIHFQFYVIALSIAIFAVLTDYLDGWLARKLAQTSTLGSLLDPVADKFFEIFLLGYLLNFYEEKLFLTYFVLMTLRNCLQLSVFPVLMWWKKISFKVRPMLPAKIATGFGMAIVLVMIVNLDLQQYTLTFVMRSLFVLGIGLEVYMLVTFIPRYWLIYHGRHDTFI
ncbi:MAG: hypothetical protein CME62_03905 [Halobacteriovoraceae bacterium]|nr:hypothetical protein [Halobacteriovoraceae bacterium]|tara:strand:- start:7556 stop:8119 length:564 start_codon:yes stop_codon:yes gene_type:complete